MNPPLTPGATSGQGWVARVALPAPSLQDNAADADRLSRALQRQFALDAMDIDLELRRQLPALLRASDYAVRCLVFQDRGRGILVYAGPVDGETVLAGLAIDLGTTRVVVRLVDLDNHSTLAESSFDNPQTRIGPDILVRIHHADAPGGLAELNRLIIDELNRQVAVLCRACHLSPHDIYLIAVAGNTTMSHLFAGLPVHWMIREPYIPAVNQFELIPAQRLGLAAAPHAQVLVLPNVGSYFGGDLIAGILYSGIYQQAETALLVDVGTNAEVVLGNRDWLMACAGAAGPALEGGMSQMGTTAVPGAIDRVRIDPDSRTFDLHTIDDLPPVGICGSGVIDMAAQLFLASMIDIRGKFRPQACKGRLHHQNGMPGLTITAAEQSGDGRDLTLSQADLDSLVRSKAAMYTILETITAAMGVELGALTTVYVAGTFGTRINPRSAVTIGMLPDLPLDCYRSIGNSSLGGAVMALTQRSAPEMIGNIRDSVTYMELNVNQDFMNRFSAAKFLPHTDRSRFASVPVQGPIF
jgi:uncharacterized 2Fe-2S/4Fe-4S cluster protein (DUF4445 family)